MTAPQAVNRSLVAAYVAVIGASWMPADPVLGAVIGAVVAVVCLWAVEALTPDVR